MRVSRGRGGVNGNKRFQNENERKSKQTVRLDEWRLMRADEGGNKTAMKANERKSAATRRKVCVKVMKHAKVEKT